MRVAAWITGIAWFLICTSLSYARFARHAAPPVVVQHGAVALPPLAPEPITAPAHAPGQKNGPENSAPARVDVPAPSVATPTSSDPAVPPAPILRAAPTRPLVTPLPAPVTANGLTPMPIRKPEARQDDASATAEAGSAQNQPGSVAVEPAARCMECGAPAASWVEVNGRRVGYCRQHYSQLALPRGERERSRTPAPAPAAPPAMENTPAPVEEPAAVQCRGFTKDGTRCRRKTLDPSGYCYQHRPR